MKFNIDMKYLHISCLNCRACFPEMVPARYVITPNNTQSKGIFVFQIFMDNIKDVYR